MSGNRRIQCDSLDAEILSELVKTIVSLFVLTHFNITFRYILTPFLATLASTIVYLPIRYVSRISVIAVNTIRELIFSTSPLQGSVCFLLGLFFIFVRWPIVGIIFEIYACVVLFGLVST